MEFQISGSILFVYSASVPRNLRYLQYSMDKNECIILHTVQHMNGVSPDSQCHMDLSSNDIPTSDTVITYRVSGFLAGTKNTQYTMYSMYSMYGNYGMYDNYMVFHHQAEEFSIKNVTCSKHSIDDEGCVAGQTSDMFTIGSNRPKDGVSFVVHLKATSPTHKTFPFFTITLADYMTNSRIDVVIQWRKRSQNITKLANALAEYLNEFILILYPQLDGFHYGLRFEKDV